MKRYERLALILWLIAFGAATALGVDRFRVEVNPHTPALEWDSASGTTYRIEGVEQLGAGNWTSLLNATGTGSRLSMSDPSLSWTSCFYRLCITTPPEKFMVDAASGAVRYLQAILDVDPAGTGGLPRDHAMISHLDSNSFPKADFFVPSEIGVWMTTAILGHAYRTSHTNFTVAFDTAALTNYIGASVRAITNILAQYAYVDSVTMGKAFYQLHYTPTGSAPRGTGFEKTISLLDHGWLLASLHATALYMKRIDEGLSDQLKAALTNFNMGMWMSTNGLSMMIGGPENPRGGGPLDRILSEGRLAAVTARARGEISKDTFEFLIKSMMAASSPGVTEAGHLIQYLPYFGMALELWACTPYLTPELDSVLGRGALATLVEGWEETRLREGLPAAGATGILDGYTNSNGNSYFPFSLSPSEHWDGIANTESNATHNVHIVVSPAAGMQAGAMGSKGSVDNFVRAYHAAQLEGRVHPIFGLSSHFDCGSGRVDDSDPIFVTLEIGQMAVALLNRLLGGHYIENLLREDAGWNTAFNEYAAYCQHMVWPKKSDPSGTGGPWINRTHAISGTNRTDGTAWHLANGAYADFDIPVSVPGECDVVVRYSNDDTGSCDRIDVSVNDVVKGSFLTENTKKTNEISGEGWDHFVDSIPIPVGSLSMGTNTVRLRMTQDDGYGVDIDLVSLVHVPSNVLREAEDSPMDTDGVSKCRDHASGSLTWYLPTNGMTAAYDISLLQTGSYHLAIRYSNDDLGTGDVVRILVNGEDRASFRTEDTGDGGYGWDRFVMSPLLPLGVLTGETARITLRVDDSDGHGVEFDYLRLFLDE
jgi:hypothetical protein